MRRYQVYTMFVQDESQSWTTREYSYFVENSSQTVSPLHDTPFLLPERGVGVYFYHREFQAIRKLQKSPSSHR